ncbi:hypothetical protein C8R44DRAFT_749173 [Mycena epipterygia]|nr:hypothetical protein C8R44DRAFT_749173 [Mycena epipterygia]
MRGPSHEVVDFTEEIRRLQWLMDEAARERDELQLFIDAHLALVSPVRRLPHDIVRAVFMACPPSTQNPTITSDEFYARFAEPGGALRAHDAAHMGAHPHRRSDGGEPMGLMNLW